MYNITVREPWFSFIQKGEKTVEGRLNKGRFSKLKSKDVIIWENENEKFKVKIEYVNEYSSFKEMIEKEGLDKVLPSINSVNDGIQVYRQFYT